MAAIIFGHIQRKHSITGAQTTTQDVFELTIANESLTFRKREPLQSPTINSQLSNAKPDISPYLAGFEINLFKMRFYAKN